ncbi:MAG: EpsG family protein [Prevotella sp.]|nr:EpsG family protein [Prevotella sp.]
MNGTNFGIESFYFYFFFFLIFFVLGCQGLFAKSSQRKQFFLACFSLLYLMAALRGITVGGDLKRYLPEFHSVSLSSFQYIIEFGRHESGYLIYIKLLSLISSAERCFLVGTSLASLVGPFYLFYRYSKCPVASILLYYAMGYYTNTFNNVRQSIAISIIFCVIPYLLDRKMWKYIIGVLLATTFHYSALVMLIVYPLINKPIDTKKLLVYAGVGLGVVGVFGYFFLSYVAETFLTRFDPESFMEEGEGPGYGLFFFYVIIFLLISSFYIYQKDKMNSNQCKMMSLFVVFQMFAMIIQLSAPIHHSMVRMTYYFFIPIVTIGVPYIGSYIIKRNRVVFYLPIFVFAIYYMIRVYSRAPEYMTNSQGVIPYILIETPIF